MAEGSVQRLADLREPPQEGRFYLVPVVAAFPYHGRVDDWPVIGPKHTDADFFRFTLEHYHIDGRFLTERQCRFLQSRTTSRAYPSIESVLNGFPLSSHDARLPNGRPPLRRRKCRVAAHDYKLGHRPEIQALRAHFGDPAQPIRLGDGRVLCPHRKADLTQFPADQDGVVTCPLHGLRVCVGRPSTEGAIHG